MSEYAPYNRASKYTKQKWMELKGEIGKSTVMLEILILFYSAIDRTRQKISKDIGDLNNSIDHLT